jgi:ADP-ribosylglycohydrolase
MALLLAESLIAVHRFDSDEYAARLLAWHARGSFDTGPVAEAVFRRAARGSPLASAARGVDAAMRGMTAGCNPAHRCAPLAFAASVPWAELEAAAREQARLTHVHVLAGDAAATVALLLRKLVTGAAWEAALASLPSHLRPPPTALSHDSREGLRDDGFSPHVLRAALYFTSLAETFQAALDTSVAFAGPANYCPVLVGALAGARFGASAIPASALAHCSRDDLARVDAAATSLSALWLKDPQ